MKRYVYIWKQSPFQSQIREIRKMIADGVLSENYNYNDVPLLTGERQSKIPKNIFPTQAISSTRPM